MTIQVEELLRQFAETERQHQYITEYYANNGNISAAAKALGIDRKVVSRAIAKLNSRAQEAGFQLHEEEPRVLFIDIETTPIKGYVWHLFQQGLTGGHRYIEEEVTILSFVAKWKGDEQGAFFGRNEHTEEELLDLIWNYLNEADWVVAHNGDNFDMKWINGRMLRAHMRPYSPVKQIDTLKMAKRRFKFPSNKLDFIAYALLGEKKVDTGGFELWLQCAEGDPEAWAKMEEYNLVDVDLLERVYYRMAAWDKSHPNYALWSGQADNTHMCGTCGSTDITHTEGDYVRTASGVYENHVCGNCGANWRGRKRVYGAELAASQ